MIGYIYITTNSVNDIVYIGKRQKPKFEKCYKGSGKHLKLAFAKYGKDKFHTEILEKCDSVVDLCNAEKKWIAEYKNKGYELYNIAAGGEGGNNVDWASLSKEKRLEINKKNSYSHKGEKNVNYGKKMSEEQKAKIRLSARRYKPKEELEKEIKTKRKHLKPIAQIDINNNSVIKIWDNWCVAGRSFKEGRTGYTHIADCCRKTRNKAFGYKWCYASELEYTL